MVPIERSVGAGREGMMALGERWAEGRSRPGTWSSQAWYSSLRSYSVRTASCQRVQARTRSRDLRYCTRWGLGRAERGSAVWAVWRAALLNAISIAPLRSGPLTG